MVTFEAVIEDSCGTACCVASLDEAVAPSELTIELGPFPLLVPGPLDGETPLPGSALVAGGGTLPLLDPSGGEVPPMSPFPFPLVEPLPWDVGGGLLLLFTPVGAGLSADVV